MLSQAKGSLCDDGNATLMPSKVYLVESLAEAQCLADHLVAHVTEPHDVLVVGLDPSARAFLMSKGVDCADTLPFFDNASHARAALGTQGLDELVRDDFDLDLRDGLQQSYKNRFSFLLLFFARHAITAIEVLDGILERHPNCVTIACCASPASHPLTSVCEHFCLNRDLRFDAIPAPEPRAAPNAKAGVAVASFRRIEARLVAWSYVAVLRRLSRARTVLFATAGTNIASIGHELRSRYRQVRHVYCRYDPYEPKNELIRTAFWYLASLIGAQPSNKLLTIPLSHFRPSRESAQRSTAREAISEHIARFMSDHRDRLTYRGVSYVDALASRQEHLTDLLLRHYELGVAETHLLRLLRPAMILSPSGGQVFHVLGELSKRLGIPAIVVPMKTLTAPDNALEESGALEIGQDMLTEAYPIAVAQSQGAESYMRYVGYSGQIIRSGPLMRTRISDAQRAASRQRFHAARGTPGHVVVYAPSMKPAAPFHIVQTLDEVVSSMQDLAKAVAELPHTTLILRLHPNLARLQHDLPRLLDLSANTIVDAATYDDIDGALALADVLVSNMSTTIEDALCNRVPVVIYDRWSRYNYLRAPIVMSSHPSAISPAYYVAAEEKLATTLAWVLANHEAGTEFSEAVMETYVYSESRTTAFHDFVQHILEG